MKFRILILFLLLSLTGSAQSVLFCEDVSAEGKPVHASSYFIIGNNGGSLMMLIQLSDVINSHSLKIDVFKMNEDTKKEIYHSSIQANPKPHYTWFKKEINFHEAGEYIVYVYDETDKLIGVGKVRIVVG